MAWSAAATSAEPPPSPAPMGMVFSRVGDGEGGLPSGGLAEGVSGLVDACCFFVEFFRHVAGYGDGIFWCWVEG